MQESRCLFILTTIAPNTVLHALHFGTAGMVASASKCSHTRSRGRPGGALFFFYAFRQATFLPCPEVCRLSFSIRRHITLRCYSVPFHYGPEQHLRFIFITSFFVRSSKSIIENSCKEKVKYDSSTIIKTVIHINFPQLSNEAHLEVEKPPQGRLALAVQRKLSMKFPTRFHHLSRNEVVPKVLIRKRNGHHKRYHHC